MITRTMNHCASMSQSGAHHAWRASNDRLPVELLSEVFLYLAMLFFDEEIPPNGSPKFHDVRTTQSSIYGWLAVTEVCHYWRDVALSCSRLWNYVDVAAPCWEEILKRSNRTDNLRVVCRSDCFSRCRGACYLAQDTLTTASDSVLTQMHRIRSVKFFMSPCFLNHSDAHKFLAGATSQLTHLCIIFAQTRTKTGPLAELPKSMDIFGRASSLQYLTIQRAVWTRKCPALTHLVRLELFMVNIVDRNEFFKLLNASPQLETLVLIEIEFDDEIEIPLDPYGYSLDSLRHLTLDTGPTFLDDIAFHFAVPEAVNWDITSDDEPFFFVQTLEEWSILSGDFSQIKVYIELFDGRIDITFVASKTAGGLSGSEGNIETTIIRKNKLFCSGIRLDYLGMVLNKLVHENMWEMYNSLEITIHDSWETCKELEWSYDDWRSYVLCFFDRMHSIVLKGSLRGANARCILRHLTTPLGTAEEGQDEIAHYSNLKSLVLDRIDFSRRRTHMWDHLLVVAETVPERLQTVRFLGGCRGLSLVKMDELREIVDTVIWDDTLLDYQDEDYSEDENWLGSEDASLSYASGSDSEAGSDDNQADISVAIRAERQRMVSPGGNSVSSSGSADSD